MKLPKHNGIVNTRYRFSVKTGPAAFAGPIKLKIKTTGDVRPCKTRWTKQPPTRSKSLAKLQLLGDGGVAADVSVMKIVEQTAALADHYQQTTA